MGAKKRPFYRIVAADARAPRDGRFLDIVGTYNPLTDPPEVKVDQEKLQRWVSQGAQLTGTVKGLLKTQGLL